MYKKYIGTVHCITVYCFGWKMLIIDNGNNHRIDYEYKTMIYHARCINFVFLPSKFCFNISNFLASGTEPKMEIYPCEYCNEDDIKFEWTRLYVIFSLSKAYNDSHCYLHSSSSFFFFLALLHCLSIWKCLNKMLCHLLIL